MTLIKGYDTKKRSLRRKKRGYEGKNRAEVEIREKNVQGGGGGCRTPGGAETQFLR